MKDLKHIRFYESLLEQADNELVRQAKREGGVAVGYTCYYLPEPLLNCGTAFSVRLRAPNTGSLDISQYYMTSFICGYARALFERAFEGGFNFLDFYASSDTCQQMVRVAENIHELGLSEAPGFSYGIIDAPMKVSEHGMKQGAADPQPHPRAAAGSLRRRYRRREHPGGGQGAQRALRDL